MNRRWRRRAKWAGTVVTIAIAAVWLASGWYGAGVGYDYGPRRTAGAALWYGVLECWTGARAGEDLQQGFWYERPLLHSRPPRWMMLPAWDSSFLRYNAVIPLWIPFLLVAAPTVWLWRLDRRRAPGACVKCGYDLSGIASGTCPECGAGP